MIRRLLLPLVLLAALPAFADYAAVQRALQSELGRPMYIPLLGFARFATWIVHPKGVHDFQLTTWEKASVIEDGASLESLLQRGLSRDFHPLVRARSRGEWTYIYARAAGDRIELIVLTHDHTDTVLVRADVDADKLSETINERRLSR